MRAGGKADFYGTVGQDGLRIKKTVAEIGLDDAGILISDMPTGRALIQVSETGENGIVLFPGANHSLLHEQRWTGGDYPFPDASHLLLQNEIPMESIHYALNNCRNSVTIFNPSPLPTSEQIDSFPWHKIDWLLINEGEAFDLHHAFTHPDRDISKPNPSISAQELVVGLSAQPPLNKTNIICTLGKDGVLALIPKFHKSSIPHEVSSFMYCPAIELQGETRDTTGAGDCFTGYFVQGLMEFGPHAEVGKEIQELDIAHILKTSVHAAGMCVEKSGTIDSMPTRAEVEARMISE